MLRYAVETDNRSRKPPNLIWTKKPGFATLRDLFNRSAEGDTRHGASRVLSSVAVCRAHVFSFRSSTPTLSSHSLQRKLVMILRRWVATLSVLVVSVIAAPSRGENSAPLAHSDSAAVQKDDSHLTVVEAGNSDDTPILDTSTKKKKASPSVWSKLAHPSKWFSSSPKKK
jgi:hypothetical protein